MTGGEKSCRTTRSMVPKESPTTRIMGYSSFDCIKNPWIDDNLKFISNEHEVNTSLISEDPDSLSNLNRLEEDDDASSGSDDSYNSCNLTIPSKKDKQVFFNILKHFLEDRTILQEGNEEERWCDKSKLKLKYMGRKCNALILDGDGNELWKGIIKTKNIYLNWRGDEEEPLSLENLQIVQNTLKFLGIQNNKVCNCFSLARTKLMEEQKWVQENMKLKIICCEVILTFGKGKNLATVLYDDIEKIPKYNMEMALWYTKLYRNLRFLPAWLVTIFLRASICVPYIGSFLQYLPQLLSLCSKNKQL